MNLGELGHRIGIPYHVIKSYERDNVVTLHKWQDKCLAESRILVDGTNLIFQAPTSGGKTLIAELVLLQHAYMNNINNNVNNNGNTSLTSKTLSIYVVPFVSLVLEKVEDFKKRTRRIKNSDEKKIKVKGLYGDLSPMSCLYANIVVCTMDKANAFLHCIFKEGYSTRLRTIVIDEIHLLGENRRGAMLESLIAKVTYLQHQADIHNNKQIFCKIVGMSATLSNVEQMGSWFSRCSMATRSSRASHGILRSPINHFKSDKRPVELMEYAVMLPTGIIIDKFESQHETIKISSQIQATCSSILSSSSTVSASSSSSSLSLSSLLDMKSEMNVKKSLLIAQIVLESINENQQVLIFCSTRSRTEVVARQLKELLQIEISSDIERDTIKKKLEEEKSTSVPSASLDSLIDIVRSSIAFHHASLSGESRQTLEKAFKNKILRVLVATTTLAVGVNLPAARVIIADMQVGMESLDCVRYRQMCGRAGRMGLLKAHECGECYLFTTHQNAAIELMTAPPPAITSQMHPDADQGRGLLRVLLEVLVLQLCSNVGEIYQFLDHTLLFQELVYKFPKLADLKRERQHLHNCVERILLYLAQTKVIEHQDGKTSLEIEGDDGTLLYLSNSTVALRPTRYGQSLVEAGLGPGEGSLFYADLYIALDGLNLETLLHTTYLISPIDNNIQPNFRLIQDLYKNAKKNDSTFYRVCNLVGITDDVVEQYLLKWNSTTPPSTQALLECTNHLRELNLPIKDKSTSTNNTHSNSSRSTRKNNYSRIGNMSENEKHALRCFKRLWMAVLLCDMLENGKSTVQVSRSCNVDVNDIESFFRTARLSVSRVQRFCVAIGWSVLAAVVSALKERMDTYAKLNNEEHETISDLMNLPRITKEQVQLLNKISIHNIYDLCRCDKGRLINEILQNLPFIVNGCSNTGYSNTNHESNIDMQDRMRQKNVKNIVTEWLKVATQLIKSHNKEENREDILRTDNEASDWDIVNSGLDKNWRTATASTSLSHFDIDDKGLLPEYESASETSDGEGDVGEFDDIKDSQDSEGVRFMPSARPWEINPPSSPSKIDDNYPPPSSQVQSQFQFQSLTQTQTQTQSSYSRTQSQSQSQSRPQAVYGHNNKMGRFNLKMDVHCGGGDIKTKTKLNPIPMNVDAMPDTIPVSTSEATLSSSTTAAPATSSYAPMASYDSDCEFISDTDMAKLAQLESDAITILSTSSGNGNGNGSGAGMSSQSTNTPSTRRIFAAIENLHEAEATKRKKINDDSSITNNYINDNNTMNAGNME